MLRIRTGARHGLRWSVFGFVAAVLTISSDQSGAAPYADIVVDANSGTVMHATNPDARRHPASLTKIMTLYLLFEQLEAGKLKLDSQLKVSAAAAAQMPTKLGLKAGTTIQVEDAIKGIITRSANDASVVVAEAIAGDEDDFAKLMTRKALALGMSRTVYRNASGLPDDDQVTTARDQATLGRAIQERFPKYYKYFSIRSFTFRGQSIGNHNHLLGRVEGVDGIKTGYINASGFNLVTSVHRGNRYLVAVVMGGGSAGSRDAKMRELINDKIAQASTKRTVPIVADADVPEAKGEPKAVAKVETKPEARQEPKFAVASAVSAPARFVPGSPRAEPAGTASVAQLRVAAGSTDPIRPVPVKTLTVKSGAPTPAPVPLQVAPQPAAEPAPTPAPAPVQAAPSAPAPAAVPVPAPAATPVPVQAAPPAPPPAPAPTVAAKPEIAAKPDVAAKPEQRLALASATSAPARFIPTTPPAEPAATRPEPLAFAPPPPPGAAPGVLGVLPARSAAFEPSSAPAAAPPPASAKPVVRSGWMIQVGAYPAEEDAKQRLSTVQSKASKILNGADPFTETVDKGGTTYYRARFAGLDKDKAEAACKYLKKNDVECVTIKN
jgi:D-alanyl-D-alanine carboxypeptidase